MADELYPKEKISNSAVAKGDRCNFCGQAVKKSESGKHDCDMKRIIMGRSGE